ncbi:hypothetical protein FEM48_Zijuj12G0085000 [Ziziphus jujuba var. spinosa]|uniref:Legume lectin domain-containing protein n=1 Tax=Ziziphus jujuba var. spinosa TaxID=714518 RepID=A0A978UC89_ZIZJJ|nr:hypothetical protein FEM48_Zijuj12G0085000 [Ziziphus jujuba var. spinosa]
MVTMHFSLLLKQILLIALWCSAFFADQVGCLSFSYPKFETKNEDDFIRSHSYLVQGAIQVTTDVRGGDITNLSGRAMYKKPFKLWRKGKGDHPTIASFNSTFVLRITPDPNPGEGLAFILTENTTLPENSDGKWLGIVNQNTNGSSHAKIVAVEFDTRKSYEEDIDNNHVGLDVNSINSKKQVRLINHGVNVSTGTDITVKVEYDGKNISVFFPVSNETERQMKNPVLTMAVNLSDFLPEKTFVGFSASTGNTHTQLNCIRSWDFYSSDIGENPNLLWVWITVPGIVALLGGVLVFYMYWTRKHDSEDLEDSYPRIEEQIQGYSMAPKNKGKIHDAVDLRLKEYDEEEMVRVLILGLACCHPNPHERPSMRAVLKVLIGEADPPLVSTDIPTFMWPPMPSFPNYSETSMQTRFTQLTGR